MQVTLRRALTGAFLACLTTVGALWPTAQAQNDLAPAGPPSSIMTGRPGDNPMPAFGTLLYDNGPIVNLPGGGSGGADASVLQNGSLGMGTFGFGHAISAGIQVADDFEVPAGGWDIDEMIFFAYQTGSTTTSTMTEYRIQIWDGDPSLPGSTVVFGDLTTNRFVSSTWGNIYRVTETTLTNTQRPVMLTTTAVDVTLPAGTYWVEWTTGGTLASGPWVPAVTINGQTTTGNGLQSIAGVWNPLIDVGPQGLPFQIIGTPLGGGGTTFCSAVATDMPGGQPATTSGPFAPYPNTVTVSGVTGTVTDVNIRFMGTNHTFPDDLDIFVEGPLGGTAIMMSDAGSSFDIVGVDLTFDDEAAAAIPDATAITTGSYQGANYGVGDVYDPPAPAPAANSLLSVFDGLDPNGTWNLWGDDDLGGDAGSMTDWCIDFEVGGGPDVNTYPSTDTPIAIPDNLPSGITSTITVPASPNIVLDVDVDMNVTHTWVGDMLMTLTKGATTVAIFDQPGVPATTFGCSGDNVDIVMDDEGTDGSVDGSCTSATPAYPVPGGHYTPDNALSAFDGLAVEGDWVLNISDNAGGDTGTLDSWALIITEDVSTAGPGNPTAAEASLRVLPNPMNAAGSVELTVPTSQDVRVAVYDMLGREVMVLWEGSVAASQRAIISMASGRLDSGVYVVRAVGETFQVIQRLTVSR